MNKITYHITIFIFYLSLPMNAFGVNNYLKNNDIEERKIIVIDAGHGGHDSGACGKKYKEKDLALQIALKLGLAINEKYPNFEVIYTRTDDIFLPLYRRIAIANKKKADLFISIHCNYVKNPNTKGTETFVMGLHRAEENLLVAQRENEVILMENDYESNYEGFDPNSPVGHILLSSFQDAYMEKSLELASKVEQNLHKRGLSASRGVKQAGFAVLRRATMPSVLIETGFISNEDEEIWLSSEEGQFKICNSIASALSDFFEQEEVEITYSREEKHSSQQYINNHHSYPEIERQRIQVAALRSKMEVQILKNLEKIGTVEIVEQNGYFKYQLIDFISMESTQKALKELEKIGFGGAFIVKN